MRNMNKIPTYTITPGPSGPESNGNLCVLLHSLEYYNKSLTNQCCLVSDTQDSVFSRSHYSSAEDTVSFILRPVVEPVNFNLHFLSLFNHKFFFFSSW